MFPAPGRLEHGGVVRSGTFRTFLQTVRREHEPRERPLNVAVAVGRLALGRQHGHAIAGSVRGVGQVREHWVGDIMAGSAQVLALMAAAVELLMLSVGIREWPALGIVLPGCQVLRDQKDVPSAILRIRRTHGRIVGEKAIAIEEVNGGRCQRIRRIGRMVNLLRPDCHGETIFYYANA